MVKKISSVKSTSITPQANGLTVKGLVTYEDGSTDSLGITQAGCKAASGTVCANINCP